VGKQLNAYLTDVLLRFTTRGDFVMDLGCHVGTLSVPAAALGRKVLAVDASPLHAEAVRTAARRNILDTLDVEWAAIARSEGELVFQENGLWGMVVQSGTGGDGQVRVPARRADALARHRGWPRVDFVKMDVEGSELAALESLGAYLTGDQAPVIVYESNGMTFELFGYSIVDIRTYLEKLDYVTCRLEDGSLVYCAPEELQPEAWLDVVALPPRWRRTESIAPSWEREPMVVRCVEWGTNEHENVRRYLHHAFASDARYPADDPRIIRLRGDLEAEFGPVVTGRGAGAARR
jgi:FkbM family methyltransferase